MRLFEITTAITPDKFTPGEVARPRDTKFAMDNQEELGSGVFGTAWATPEEPGTVRKVVGPLSENDFKRDAYYKYIQLLAKNDRFTSNPYFPKIFDVQVKKWPLEPGNPTTFYDYAYAIDIERLHEWAAGAGHEGGGASGRGLSNKEARMLGNKMFHNYEQIAKREITNNTVKSNRPRMNPKNKKEQLTHTNWDGALIDFIGEIIDTFASPTKKATIFKDPQMKQAVMLLQHLKNKTQDSGMSMFFDLHTGNIMIRRGPGGPQLVFTDPVAN